MKLLLKDSALQFFLTLYANARADLDLTIAALETLFFHRSLREIHSFNFENRKLNKKTESPVAGLVKFQNKAMEFYPAPVDQQ